MKSFFKLVTFLSLTALATACDVKGTAKKLGEGIPDPSEKITEQALQGTVNNQAWTIKTAVGKMQSDGLLLVTISGNDEVINCKYSTPLQPGAMFSVPLNIAEYDFDMLRPTEGYPVTWVYTDSSGQIQNVFSDIAKISITAINNDRISAGIYAKFMDPSHPGKIDGRFEIILCQ